MRKLLLIFLTLYLFIFTVPTAKAVDEGWVIDNFSSEITIQTDGKIQVLETIDVDFGPLNKHGIFRDIPYVYYSTGEPLYTEIKVLSVLQNRQPAIYTVYKNGNFQEIKIGDPKKTFAGKVTYKINYLETGVLRSFGDYDELYLDVTGEGWPVTIKKADAIVTLVKGEILRITCFEGNYGTTNKCSSTTTSKTTASFKATTPLLSRQNLTVTVGIPKNTFPILKPEQPYEKQNEVLLKYYSPQHYLPDLYISTFAFFVGLAGIYFLWLKKGRDGKNQALTVQYNPPAELKPAVLGTLVDESADTLDVSATIIDLAVKGYLTIEEKPKSWFLGKNDYILRWIKKNTSELLMYEKELLKSIFLSGDEVKMSELKNVFYKDLARIKKLLYQEVVDRGFFNVSPEQTKKSYFAFATLLLIASASFFGYGYYNSSFISGLGLAAILNSAILIFFSLFMPKKTPLGLKVYYQGLGYKMFLEKVEIYKQRFLENKNLFNEVMPYTIVFGITDKFAKVFASLDINVKQPTWYTSPNSFNYLTFSSSVNNFSFLMSSAISYHAQNSGISNSFSVSSSSGFSSGGGFSGGGFGGGGGGSW